MDYEPLVGFLENLSHTQPSIYEILSSIVEDYEKCSIHILKNKQNNKKAQDKYRNTEKGRERRREACRRYYYRKKAERVSQSNSLSIK